MALSRFNDTSGFNTIGANHHLLSPALIYRAHVLQIGFETPFGHIMGMADIIANQGSFTTNFTYSGHFSLQYHLSG